MFYRFNQNNSGGYYVIDADAGVGESIHIEANNVDEARDKFEAIGNTVAGFDSFCECCGQRWSPFWLDETDATEFPADYGKEVDYNGTGSYVHYADGRVVEVGRNKEIGW